ncbi:hypothetical protein [Agromyces sp. GXQ0307]|uniref:hypothetical protein n=1 Tax=Agromyces sp. GXQ0307 TaxID=3377835 RepID=UPI003839D811
MGVAAHGSRSVGEGVATPSGIDSTRRRRVVIPIAIIIALSACASPGGAGSPTGSPSPDASAEPTEEVMTDASVDDLVADPEGWLDRRVEVEGKVFFLSQCPPPGAEATPCVLVGYLADPGLGTLIAADVDRAIPLAEDGALVTCAEPGNGAGACGEWVREATYMLQGTVERQTVDGRERRDKVWFAVDERSDPLV